MWYDAAMILFACVCANHLGLVSAVEDKAGIRLPVVNCSKCFSFWSVLLYFLFHCGVIKAVAVSFLFSYLAVWLELGMGYVDTLYNRLYDTIYTTKDEQTAPDADEGSSNGALS